MEYEPLHSIEDVQAALPTRRVAETGLNFAVQVLRWEQRRDGTPVAREIWVYDWTDEEGEDGAQQCPGFRCDVNVDASSGWSLSGMRDIKLEDAVLADLGLA